MDISAGIRASLAGRYASALFDLASENGTVTAVESDLETLSEALAESPDFAALTTSPKVGRGDARKAIAALARAMKLSALTGNFLGVLAQNRRLAQLPAVIRAFRTIAAAQRGEVTAEVTSACQMPAERSPISANGAFCSMTIKTRIKPISVPIKPSSGVT